MTYKNFIGIDKTYIKNNALIFNHKTFSSKELSEKVEALSQRLENFGITRQHRIGILIGNTPLFMCSLLAVLKRRASAVLFSVHLKKFELENYIKDTGIRVLITEEKFEGLIRDLPVDKTAIDSDPDSIFGQLKIWRIFSPAPEENNDILPVPGNWEDKEFTLQFTSGVGGRSKIVPRSYHNVFDELVSYARSTDLTPEDIVVCPAPLFHAYGLINGFLAPFYKGATSILMERFIPNDFIKLVKKYKPTIFIGVPFMYDILCRTYLDEEVDFSSLRICFSAGAKLSREVAERFSTRFGVRINQQYGSTETGTIAVNLYRDGFDDINAVGPPLHGRKIKIVNEIGHEVAVGEEGQIKIHSQGTTCGYLGPEELNREQFREGWYFTKDIGRMDADGNVYITGRKSSFVNVAGLKVDPFEVERVLLSMDHIKECAVVGREDKRNSSEIVKAFVVIEKEIQVNDIKKFCKEKLADYKVPREIEVVEELPRSATGKILKKYLITGSDEKTK
jgi:long-chain acyl-CoA synthetase